MKSLITQDPAALQLLMTDDIYLISEKQKSVIKIQDNTVPESFSSVEEVVEAEKEAAIVTSVRDFTYLGENNKYFLILIDDKAHKELNAPHLELLLKIMLAKKLELRDLAILNLNNYPNVSFTDLKEFFGCNRLALFGISPLQISLPSLTANQSEKHDGVSILATYSLEEMINDETKKKQFWNVMKSF